jgi:hypothetical protein
MEARRGQCLVTGISPLAGSVSDSPGNVVPL